MYILLFMAPFLTLFVYCVIFLRKLGQSLNEIWNDITAEIIAQTSAIKHDNYHLTARISAMNDTLLFELSSAQERLLESQKEADTIRSCNAQLAANLMEMRFDDRQETQLKMLLLISNVASLDLLNLQ